MINRETIPSAIGVAAVLRRSWYVQPDYLLDDALGIPTVSFVDLYAGVDTGGGHEGRHQSWLMTMLKTETLDAGAPPQVPGDDARHQICEKIQQSEALNAFSQHKRARTALTRNTAIRVSPKQSQEPRYSTESSCPAPNSNHQ